jgi:hypothetical protein
MLFDLTTLLSQEYDLEALELPFSHAEIDNVIRLLPLDKSLGPDGFSNEFSKKC